MFHRLGFLIVILSSGCNTLRPSELKQSEAEKFDQKIIAQIERGEKLGVAVALLQNGTVTYKNYGRQTLISDLLPNENSIFEIGSLTKVFNTIVLAKKHVNGQLKVDDNIAKYNPLLKWHGAKTVTLEQLATHMSGLSPIFSSEKWQRILDSRNPFSRFSKEDFLAALAELPDPKPAETFKLEQNYSNIGAALLGMTLAEVDARPYEIVIETQLLEPLGLSDTSISLSPDQKKEIC